MALPNLWQGLYPGALTNSVCGLLKPLAVIVWIHIPPPVNPPELCRLEEAGSQKLHGRPLNFCDPASSNHHNSGKKRGGGGGGGESYDSDQCVQISVVNGVVPNGKGSSNWLKPMVNIFILISSRCYMFVCFVVSQSCFLLFIQVNPTLVMFPSLYTGQSTVVLFPSFYRGQSNSGHVSSFLYKSIQQ